MTRRVGGRGPLALRAAVAITVVAVVAVLGGCSSAADDAANDRSVEDTRTGYGMGGVEQDIKLPASVLADKPEKWDLTTPESAVRSYLDWVSYAYRTSESNEATATQSDNQVVRTDAYIQANLQASRLLDQRLSSITFGSPRVVGETTLLPAKERWSYRYMSINEPGKTIEGPLTASYETTYALIKLDRGWVVDDIEVTTIGNVK